MPSIGSAIMRGARSCYAGFAAMASPPTVILTRAPGPAPWKAWAKPCRSATAATRLRPRPWSGVEAREHGVGLAAAVRDVARRCIVGLEGGARMLERAPRPGQRRTRRMRRSLADGAGLDHQPFGFVHHPVGDPRRFVEFVAAAGG